MKKSFDYRGYRVTLTGVFGFCWDLFANNDDPKEEAFSVPGICCEAGNLEELIAEAKEVMDENVYEDEEAEDEIR